MSLEDLVVDIRIEESHWQKDKNDLANDSSLRPIWLNKTNPENLKIFRNSLERKDLTRNLRKGRISSSNMIRSRKRKKVHAFVCGKIGHNAA